MESKPIKNKSGGHRPITNSKVRPDEPWPESMFRAALTPQDKAVKPPPPAQGPNTGDEDDD